jgi:hypothetical protein
VVRVFWRDGAPWVLARLPSGAAVPLAWSATDLPTPAATGAPAGAPAPPLLLTPPALLALLRFLRDRSGAVAPAEPPGRDRP